MPFCGTESKPLCARQDCAHETSSETCDDPLKPRSPRKAKRPKGRRPKRFRKPNPGRNREPPKKPPPRNPAGPPKKLGPRNPEVPKKRGPPKPPMNGVPEDTGRRRNAGIPPNGRPA